MVYRFANLRIMMVLIDGMIGLLPGKKVTEVVLVLSRSGESDWQGLMIGDKDWLHILQPTVVSNVNFLV